MSDFRREYRKQFRRVSRETNWTLWKVMGLLIVPVGTLFGFATACGWLSEAASVVREEFGPRAALQKYEWFKDAAAQLEKKRADIEIFKARVTAAEKRAENGDRTDRERLSIVESELAGVMASFNSLAAEYNAASSKFNWRPFEGDGLPRTVVPYTEGK